MVAEFGIAVPQFFPDGTLDVAALAEYLRTAEGLGYASAWVSEEIFHLPALDAVGLLTFAAAHTERMRLGTAILVMPVRNPVHLAKSLLTLDLLSHGRLIVGVGLGQRTDNYPAFGVPKERRLGRYLEGVEVMKRLWSGEPVHFAGEYFTFAGEHMEPHPVQKPHPPMWFSGRAEPALARAVRLGQGWIGGMSPPDVLHANVEELHRNLETAKRDPAEFGLAKRIFVHLDADKARAEARIRPWFTKTYRDRDDVTKVVVYGGAQECIDGIAGFMKAGARMPILEPVFERREQMEAIARDVLPALR